MKNKILNSSCIYSASKEPMVIAHRGASALAEHENTIESFQIAIDLHTDMVEFDVRRTGDKVLVVYHDSDIDGKRLVDMTYNRINDIAAKKGYRVPRLEDVLKLCSGKIKLDIELKESGYERQVIDMVKKWFGYGEFSIKSFKDKVSYNVKNIDPRIKTGLLVGRGKARLGVRLNEYFPIRRIRRCKADFVSPHYLLCTKEFVKRMKRKGIPVYVWTVNDESAMRHMVRQKVSAIITDRPDKLIREKLNNMNTFHNILKCD